MKGSAQPFDSDLQWENETILAFWKVSLERGDCLQV